jgi:hypothetical protein
MSKRAEWRDALDAAIVASWRPREVAESDISTERLTEIVRGDTGAESTGRLKRCKRAGTLREK